MNRSLNLNEKQFRSWSDETSIRRGQNESRHASCRIHHPDVHANSKQFLVGENVRPMGERSHQAPLPCIPSPKLHLYIRGENRVGIPQHLMHWATSRNQPLAGKLSQRIFPGGHGYGYNSNKVRLLIFEAEGNYALELIDVD